MILYIPPSADANVGIGVSVYSRKHTVFGDLTLLWVYVAAAGFSVGLCLVFFAVFSAEAVFSKRNGIYTECVLP